MIKFFGILPKMAWFACSNPQLKLSMRFAANWGLLDDEFKEGGGDGEADEDEEGAERGEEWAATEILFDPEQGMEGDKERGGFWMRAGERGNGIPIQLHSLFFPDGSSCKLTRARMGKHQGRAANSKVWISVEGFGFRLPFRNPEEVAHLVAHVGNMHRSRSEGGCAAAAAANALERRSELDAASLSGKEGKVEALGALAVRVNEACPQWRLRTEKSTLGKNEKGGWGWSSKQKVEWLLEQYEGIFILQPSARGASNAHVVAADAEAGLLYDPMEAAT